MFKINKSLIFRRGMGYNFWKINFQFFENYTPLLGVWRYNYKATNIPKYVHNEFKFWQQAGLFLRPNTAVRLKFIFEFLHNIVSDSIQIELWNTIKSIFILVLHLKIILIEAIESQTYFTNLALLISKLIVYEYLVICI